MISFEMRHPDATAEHLGLIPHFLSNGDARPAREQFASNYAHGGGWRPFPGFEMRENGIKYPGDPLMPLLAEGKLGSETIRIYECAWVAVVQADGSFEISRLD
jgi:hypothetical protein